MIVALMGITSISSHKFIESLDKKFLTIRILKVEFFLIFTEGISCVKIDFLNIATLIKTLFKIIFLGRCMSDNLSATTSTFSSTRTDIMITLNVELKIPSPSFHFFIQRLIFSDLFDIVDVGCQFVTAETDTQIDQTGQNNYNYSNKYLQKIQNDSYNSNSQSNQKQQIYKQNIPMQISFLQNRNIYFICRCIKIIQPESHLFEIITFSISIKLILMIIHVLLHHCISNYLVLHHVYFCRLFIKLGHFYLDGSSRFWMEFLFTMGVQKWVINVSCICFVIHLVITIYQFVCNDY